MKNFLIPTTFQNDTQDAVKAALNYANGNSCTIILMTVLEVLDTYSVSNLLRNLDNEWSTSQENVSEKCRAIITENPNSKLKFHNQYGVSSPLVKNLLDFFEIDLVIIPPSFKNSGYKINKQFLQIVSNYKCPILHTAKSHEANHFSNAIYLENEKSNYPLETIQHFVQKKFSLKIVSQAKVSEQEPTTEILPIVSEAISKNDVDIIIKTRKPEKIKKSRNKSTDESFGLPILSIYEEAYH